MVVWGLFSVPAWAPTIGNLGEAAAEQGWEGFFSRTPYGEWYLNSMRFAGSPTQVHHRETYGDNFAYDDFVPMFHQALERWNPNTPIGRFAASEEIAHFFVFPCSPRASYAVV